jgi:hypothetical protein
MVAEAAISVVEASCLEIAQPYYANALREGLHESKSLVLVFTRGGNCHVE